MARTDTNTRSDNSLTPCSLKCSYDYNNIDSLDLTDCCFVAADIYDDDNDNQSSSGFSKRSPANRPPDAQARQEIAAQAIQLSMVKTWKEHKAAFTQAKEAKDNVAKAARHHWQVREMKWVSKGLGMHDHQPKQIEEAEANVKDWRQKMSKAYERARDAGKTIEHVSAINRATRKRMLQFLPPMPNFKKDWERHQAGARRKNTQEGAATKEAEAKRVAMEEQNRRKIIGIKLGTYGKDPTPPKENIGQKKGQGRLRMRLLGLKEAGAKWREFRRRRTKHGWLF